MQKSLSQLLFILPRTLTAGRYRAAANGDAACLDLFHLPKMHAFSGQLTAIVQTSEQAGEIVLEAKASGLKTGKISLKAE